MKKIYLYLILASIVVLSVSQMFLWMDQVEMWKNFNLHLMLEGSKPI